MKYNLIAAATLLAFASQAFGTPTTSTTISYQCDPPAGGSGLVPSDIAAAGRTSTHSEAAFLEKLDHALTFL
ncbi:hypothetical protein BJ912DRAFT_972411, partial [Pholiota molesta]